MWVMKNSVPISIPVTEHGYLEQVQVDKNGIGVCKEAPTKDYLFSIGYDEIGQINAMEDLPAFLDKYNGKEVLVQATPQKPKIVSVADILNKPSVGSDDTDKKFWWQH